MTHLQCRKCKTVKPIDEFRDGPVSKKRMNKAVWCIDCTKAYNRARYGNMTVEQKAKRYDAIVRHNAKSLKHKAIVMLNGIKQRCKVSGHEVAVTREWLQLGLEYGRCWVTGFAFQYGKGKNGGITPFSPSIDRIDSERGYTPDNLQMVCSIYNIGKGSHDELDFVAMCMAVAEKHKDNYAAWMRLQDLRQHDVFRNER